MTYRLVILAVATSGIWLAGCSSNSSPPWAQYDGKVTPMSVGGFVADTAGSIIFGPP